MEKRLLILVCFLTTIQSMAQKLIDPNFAQAVRHYCPTCVDNGNRITEDGQKLRSLVVSIQQITDLTGVEGFSSLVSLNCENNNLTFIPRLPQSLQRLLISYNKLGNLTNLPPNLTALFCKGNQLKSLPDLPPTLETLDCSYNTLSILPQLPISLKTLFCSNNILTILPDLPKILEGLECGDNRLKNLPILPKTLNFLSCQNNTDLTCLPRLPDSLLYLYIPKGITCLPNSVKKATIERFEGIVSQRVNLPICTPIQLALCPPISPDVTILGKNLSIFPNPTEGVLHIKQQGYVIDKVLIFNSLGQLVKQIKTGEIDISFLAIGWYFIQVHTDDGIFIEKIMRQ
jgi:hypothetical protein